MAVSGVRRTMVSNASASGQEQTAEAQHNQRRWLRRHNLGSGGTVAEMIRKDAEVQDVHHPVVIDVADGIRLAEIAGEGHMGNVGYMEKTLSMTSRCPFVIGSKVPGNSPIFEPLAMDGVYQRRAMPHQSSQPFHPARWAAMGPEIPRPAGVGAR